MCAIIGAIASAVAAVVTALSEVAPVIGAASLALEGGSLIAACAGDPELASALGLLGTIFGGVAGVTGGLGSVISGATQLATAAPVGFGELAGMYHLASGVTSLSLMMTGNTEAASIFGIGSGVIGNSLALAGDGLSGLGKAAAITGLASEVGEATLMEAHQGKAASALAIGSGLTQYGMGVVDSGSPFLGPLEDPDEVLPKWIATVGSAAYEADYAGQELDDAQLSNALAGFTPGAHEGRSILSDEGVQAGLLAENDVPGQPPLGRPSDVSEADWAQTAGSLVGETVEVRLFPLFRYRVYLPDGGYLSVTDEARVFFFPYGAMAVLEGDGGIYIVTATDEPGTDGWRTIYYPAGRGGADIDALRGHVRATVWPISQSYALGDEVQPNNPPPPDTDGLPPDHGDPELQERLGLVTDLERPRGATAEGFPGPIPYYTEEEKGYGPGGERADLQRLIHFLEQSAFQLEVGRMASAPHPTSMADAGALLSREEASLARSVGGSRSFSRPRGGAALLDEPDPVISFTELGEASRRGSPPGTVTVYRVEGSSNTHVTVSPTGNVAFVGGRATTWLNFDQVERAIDYFERKVQAGLPDPALKGFDVDGAFLAEMRASAVEEWRAKNHPDAPILSRDTTDAATPVPDQFGLRPRQTKQLQGRIIPGSGWEVK